MQLRMCNDNVLIALDEDAERLAYLEKKGIELYKPQGANEHVFRTGTVLDAGPGRWAKKGNRREPMRAEKGMRVVFVKFAATHTDSARHIQTIIGKGQAIIKDQDILLDIGDLEAGDIGG